MVIPVTLPPGLLKPTSPRFTDTSLGVLEQAKIVVKIAKSEENFRQGRLQIGMRGRLHRNPHHASKRPALK